MFSKSIIGAARFLRMPATSRLLYYDLGMQADDDGVVEAFSVMRLTGATEDDLRVLVTKGFVRVLNDDLVTLISDWSKNNLIKKDRYRQSIYKDLIIQLDTNCQRGTQLEPTWNPSGTNTEQDHQHNQCLQNRGTRATRYSRSQSLCLLSLRFQPPWEYLFSTLPIGTPRKAARRLTEAPSQHPSDTEERRRERDKEEKVSSPHPP